MDTDCAMEGTIDSLLQAQPVDVLSVDRKRSGRPCVGGKGEVWDNLTAVVVELSEIRTKNGLPGVPYALKNTINALREVWTDYAPGARAGVAPHDFLWISSAAESMITAINTDIYLDSSDCARFLQSLSDVAEILSRRTSSEWLTDAQAPVALYTPELIARYAAAAAQCSPLSLHPTPSLKTHFVCWEDVERVHTACQDMLARAVENKLGSEATRTLGWASLVFTVCAPHPGRDNGAPLTTIAGTDVLNTLKVWKLADKTRVVAGDSPFLVCDSALRTATIGIPNAQGVYTHYNYSGAAADAFLWAWMQRETSVHGERLLPKRVTADVILRRASKVLSAYLHDKTLSTTGIHIAWTTWAFQDVLALLQQRIHTLQLADCDALSLLRTAVFPSTVSATPRLCFPGDDVTVTALLAE